MPERIKHEPLDDKSIRRPRAEIHLIKDQCKGCGYCIEFCPKKVFEESEEINARGVHPPKILDEGTLFDRPNPFRRVGTTPLYLGCAYQTKPHDVQTMVSVLEKVGIDPLISDEVCCGYIVEAVGVENVRIADLVIEGNKGTNDYINGCRGGGVYIHKSKNCIVENVRINEFNGDTFSWQITENITLKGCEAANGNGLGFHPGRRRSRDWAG